MNKEECAYYSGGFCLKGLPGTSCEIVGCVANVPRGVASTKVELPHGIWERDYESSGKEEGEKIGRELGEKLGKQMGEIILQGLKDEYKKGYQQALKDIEKEIEHRTLNAHDIPNGAKDKEFYCGMDAAFSDMLVFIESLES